jgi:hypothetical protein
MRRGFARARGSARGVYCQRVSKRWYPFLGAIALALRSESRCDRLESLLSAWRRSSPWIAAPARRSTMAIWEEAAERRARRPRPPAAPARAATWVRPVRFRRSTGPDRVRSPSAPRDRPEPPRAPARPTGGRSGVGGAGGAIGRDGGAPGRDGGPPGRGLLGLLPGIRPTAACTRCVDNRCDAATACSNDPACLGGVACYFTVCPSATDQNQQLACALKCFNGNFALVMTAFESVSCVYGTCGNSCR